MASLEHEKRALRSEAGSSEARNHASHRYPELRSSFEIELVGL